MERRNLFLTGITLAGMAAFLLFTAEGEDPELENLDFNVSEEEINTTESGTRFIVHPDKLREGCPSMDCIPSIDDPSFVTADEADWLDEEERVIGVEQGGEAKAYPLRILSRHEIVNDRLNGEPLLVTYCPLCRSGVAYSRSIGNETLEFGVSGKLLNANLVMYDRETESYWSQIEGRAIVGPRTGQELDLKFSSVTTWDDWEEGHPETQVLSRNTGIYPPSSYRGDLYGGFEQSERVGFGVNKVDDRLPSKEIVYGVEISGKAKAYPEKELEETLIQDEIEGIPVTIFRSPEDGTILSFVRKSGGRTLQLELRNGTLRDSEGQVWNLDGERISAEENLERLNPKGFYWFAWSKFNPETEVYNSGSEK